MKHPEQKEIPEKYSYQKLSEDDWEGFKKIRLEALQRDPQAFGSSFEKESKYAESDWEEMIDNPDRFFFAAKNDEGLVATAGAKKIGEHTWMIIAVYTTPEDRRKGLSRELIDRVTTEAHEKGATKIRLMVNADQERAVNLYEKSGFRSVETAKNQKMGDGVEYDQYVMEKEIEPEKV